MQGTLALPLNGVVLDEHEDCEYLARAINQRIMTYLAPVQFSAP